MVRKKIQMLNFEEFESQPCKEMVLLYDAFTIIYVQKFQSFKDLINPGVSFDFQYYKTYKMVYSIDSTHLIKL